MSLWDDALNELDQVLFFEEKPESYNNVAEGIFKHIRRIDYAIRRTKKHKFAIPDVLENILRVGIYLAVIDRDYPQELAVNTAVEKAKELGFSKQAGFVNAVLRRMTREWDTLSVPSKSNFPAYLAVMYSYPDFLVERWLKRYGPENTEALLAGGNGNVPRYFRINTLKINEDDLYLRLAEDGIAFSLHPTLNNFFRLEDRNIRTAEWDCVRQGLVVVQDPAFEAASLALEPKHGERILEIGCAPGGKLLRIAELAGPTSEITGIDYSEDRLDLVHDNLKQSGIGNVQLFFADGRDYSPVKPFDRVLVDPPCSSFGVIRRHPEIKLLRKEGDIKRLAELQKQLAENAMQLVRPGGVLVWSTCTTEPEENREIVDHILSYDNFELVHPKISGFEKFAEGPFIQTLPTDPDFDGAFVAVLRRKS